MSKDLGGLTSSFQLRSHQITSEHYFSLLHFTPISAFYEETREEKRKMSEKERRSLDCSTRVKLLLQDGHVAPTMWLTGEV